MALQYIIDNIDFVSVDRTWTNSEIANIQELISNAYLGSSIFRAMFDGYVQSLSPEQAAFPNPGATGLPGKIGIFGLMNKAFSFRGFGNVFIDPNYLDDALYIDSSGTAVRADLYSTIIHELGHGLAGLADLRDGENQISEDNFLITPNQDFVNSIYRQLDIPERLGYAGFDLNSDILELGRNYTFGNNVDAAVVTGVPSFDASKDRSRSGELISVLLFGNNSFNTRIGANGDDYIYGFAGNDYLFGGSGSNYIDGGLDIDTVGYKVSPISVTIEFFTEGTSGNLQAVIEGEFSDRQFADTLVAIERVELGELSNTVIVQSNSVPQGNLIVDLGNPMGGTQSSDDYDIVEFGAVSEGINTALIDTFINAERFILSSYDDVVEFSGDGAETVKEILGEGGNDSIAVGGYWFSNATSNSITIKGGAGSDVIAGGASDDTLIAGDDEEGVGSAFDDEDKLYGGDGDDRLYGGDGADLLEGNGDDDRLTGGKGDDELYGGFGDDLLIAEIGDGNDELDGGLNGLDLPIGDGTDTVVYKYYHGDATIKLISSSLLVTNSAADFGLEISSTARGRNGESGGFGFDALTSIELAAVEAGDGADRLVIDDQSDVDRINYIDLGGQSAGSFDTIAFTNWETDVFVDISAENARWVEEDAILFFDITRNLNVRNAERVLGGKGNDVLLAGVIPGVVPTYEGTGAERPDLEKDQLLDLSGDDRKRITEKVHLDGGEGNDTVILSAGEGSIAIGGEGRDFIYNRSRGGEIYGDTQDGLDKFDNEIADSSENADLIWYAPDVTLFDAGVFDQLSFNGVRLTGGKISKSYTSFFNPQGLSNAVNAARDRVQGRRAAETGIYYDKLLDSITYRTVGNGDGGTDLWVYNRYQQLFDLTFESSTLGNNGVPNGVFVIKNFIDNEGDFTDDATNGFGSLQLEVSKRNKLGLSFKTASPLEEALGLTSPLLSSSVLTTANLFELQGLAAFDALYSLSISLFLQAKSLQWVDGNDPLVIDLDGDGIELTSLDNSEVYFDIDGDQFRELTGWVKGDDGFLVLDKNGNGRIDDIGEMFGNRFEGGYAELSGYDSDGDGKITVGDLIWSELQVWQDYNQDGITDADELSSLDALGIVEFNLTSTPLDVTTPQGTQLLARGGVTFDTGEVTKAFEAIFNSNDTDTKYAGENGRAAWQGNLDINAKGFGSITDLAVAAANDIELGELLETQAAAMTVPNLKTLREQSGELLGKWGASLELTRELAPVLLGVDGDGATILLDRGVYVEDETGGYWTLNSGDDVLDADGAVIARASLEDILALSPADGEWRLEQAWSPSSRGEAVEHRNEAPYLTQIVDGRAVILDYGIEQADGTWKLASDDATVYADVAAITALAHAEGTEWRSEEIGFNPYAAIPVEAIGVRFTDGQVVDYTVELTNRAGRRPAAANDNSAWRGAAFTLMMERAA